MGVVITDKAMQAKPQGKDTWLIESGARGAGSLVGRITPAGTRAFYYRYTDASGKRVRLPIGPYDAKGDGAAGFTVQQARDQARQLAALYRSGVRDVQQHLADERAKLDADAQLAKRAREEAEAALQRRLTVRQLFDRWRATDLQPTQLADGTRSGRKDGGKFVFEQFERHVFPKIGATAVGDLSRADLLSVVDALKAAGKQRTAAMLFSDLRQMLTFAVERQLLDTNPLATLKKVRVVGRQTERERTLSASEVQQLPQALAAGRVSARTRAAVWLLLTTGMRVGEAMGCVWADCLPATGPQRETRLQELTAKAEETDVKLGLVDLESRSIYLVTTKNQRDHTIHLSDFALRVLIELYASRDTLPASDKVCPWVFPARSRLAPVCVKSFGKQISDRQRIDGTRLSARSKKTDALRLEGGPWTAHDLRRTAGTFMAELGVSNDVIDECLNHKLESRVRRTYVRHRREGEQRAAFDQLGARLAELAGMA